MLGRKHYIVKIKISACTTQVLHLETLYMNSLDKFLTVSIKSVKSIHSVMAGSVSSRIIQNKQRFESLYTSLCSLSLHFLRLVHYYNRIIGSYHVNRLSASELVTFRIDNTAFLASSTLFHRSRKCLCIYNHHVKPCIRRKAVKLRKVRTVIHKPAGLFAVMFHKMLLKHIETLCHTLTNSYARHNNNKLAPTITLVQFEHSFDIHVCLTGSCFHLYVEVHRSHTLYQSRRRSNIIKVLHRVDITQQLSYVEFHLTVTVSQIKFVTFIGFPLIVPSHVTTIACYIIRRLSGKNSHCIFHRFSLICLYLKVEFHYLLYFQFNSSYHSFRNHQLL